MPFNSAPFFAFFFAVYLAYRMVPHRAQNRLLLAASYVFYGAWDWRYLGLLGLLTLVSYLCAIRIAESRNTAHRRAFLWISVLVSLGVLGFFKYFNFFYSNLVDLAAVFGWSLSHPVWRVALPIGISFYTFQTISYVIDVHRGTLQPVRALEDFALFVAFFPQLIMGPIERGRHLLPQLMNPRTITQEHVYHGCWLILWGLYKKTFVADNLAVVVDGIFGKPVPASGLETLLGAYAFLFQAYADFSGYADMGRGLARLMGIDLVVNFKFPYLVLNPRDFWRNWNISLSNWFRDYVYFPLARRRRDSTVFYALNTLMTLVLVGLWHGAAWNFIIWGAYNACLLVLFRNRESALQPGRGAGEPEQPWLLWANLLIMFHVTAYGCLMFRAQSAWQIAAMTASVVTHPVGSVADAAASLHRYGLPLLATVWFLLLVDLVSFQKKNFQAMYTWPVPVRAACYVVMFYSLLWLGQWGGKEFVYNQF